LSVSCRDREGGGGGGGGGEGRKEEGGQGKKGRKGVRLRVQVVSHSRSPARPADPGAGIALARLFATPPPRKSLGPAGLRPGRFLRTMAARTRARKLCEDHHLYRLVGHHSGRVRGQPQCVAVIAIEPLAVGHLALAGGATGRTQKERRKELPSGAVPSPFCFLLREEGLLLLVVRRCRLASRDGDSLHGSTPIGSYRATALLYGWLLYRHLANATWNPTRGGSWPATGRGWMGRFRCRPASPF